MQFSLSSGQLGHALLPGLSLSSDSLACHARRPRMRQVDSGPPSRAFPAGAAGGIGQAPGQRPCEAGALQALRPRARQWRPPPWWRGAKPPEAVGQGLPPPAPPSASAGAVYLRLSSFLFHFSFRWELGLPGFQASRGTPADSFWAAGARRPGREPDDRARPAALPAAPDSVARTRWRYRAWLLRCGRGGAGG